MKIWVSSLALVHEAAKSARPARAVSLLGRPDAFPTLEGYHSDHHFKLTLDDIRQIEEGRVAPNGEHVQGLIAFLKDWRPDDPLLVHCWAGISRSTAAAYVAACLHNPQADEAAIASELRAASPSAWPNTLIVAHADDILGRRGRMSAAIEAIGPGDFSGLTPQSTIPAPFAIRARF